MRRGFEWGPGFDGWMVLSPPVGGLVLLLLAGLAGWLVCRALCARRTDDPLRRAAARYASGRIEWVEFDRIRRDVTATAPTEVPAAASGDEPSP